MKWTALRWPVGRRAEDLSSGSCYLLCQSKAEGKEQELMVQRIREILFDVTRRKCTQILVVWMPGKAIVSCRYRSRCYPIVSSVDGRNGILRWLTRMR